MTTMKIYDDDGDRITIDARWVICDVCHGEGKSSAYLGAITEEDRDRDWSYDEWEDYISGVYDRECDVCHGSGKVKVPIDKKWIDKLERDVEEERADQRTLYMETGGRMGRW